MEKPIRAKAIKPPVEPPAPEGFACQWCKKSFSKEKTLIAHVCEKKRRWLWRDEKYIKIGFTAYEKFYRLSMHSKKQKTYEEFMNSVYFTDFTKFGRHILTISAIEAEGFIEFLIKRSIKLTDWIAESHYEDWVREISKREPPMKAVERNILLMEQWGREHDENWIDFFRKVAPPLAIKWIRSGRISPWLLFSGVGSALFDRLSDEQLGLIKEWINPLFWNGKIRDNHAEVEQIRSILQEAGV